MASGDDAGPSINAVNRHLAHSPHARWVRLASFSFHTVNTRLHDTMWGARPRDATAAPMASSVRGRRSENHRTPVGAKAAASRRSASDDLEYWWLTGTPSAVTRLGSSAERSMPITTSAEPMATAVSTAIAEVMAVTGTWPLVAPAATRSRRAGSRRRATPSSGRPSAAARCSWAPTGFTVNSSPSGTSDATRAESLPPPTGTRGGTEPGAGSTAATGSC